MSNPIIQTFDTDHFSSQTWSPLHGLIVYVILVVAFSVALSIGRLTPLAYGARPLTIVRGFGVLYGDENKQHSGADIEAETGETVRTPVSGIVSFVGRVPGSAGLGVVAVTVKTQAGDLVTLSPLARTEAKVGDTLSKGDTVGAVAITGDPSSSGTHVHISMRVAGKYVDPAGLISATLSRATVKGVSDAKVPVREKTTASVNVVAVPAHGHIEAAVDGVSKVTANDSVPSTKTQVEPSAQVRSDVLDVSPSIADSHGEVSVAHAILLEEAKAGGEASILSDTTRPKGLESLKVGRVHDADMVPPLSAGQLAVCIFLIGISLTFAGVQVVKVIGGKSDLIGRFEHLAVRGHR